MKKIYFIILALLSFIYIVTEVRKKKFSIKESFWWVMAALLILVLSIFPYSIDSVAKFLNVVYPPSLLFVGCILFLLFINFRNCKQIAMQQEKIIELAQHVAILENMVEEKDKK